MIDDHAGVNNRRRAGDQPQSQAAAQPDQPDPEIESNLPDPKRLEGNAFDKAYTDHEVASHQQFIAIDRR